MALIRANGGNGGGSVSSAKNYYTVDSGTASANAYYSTYTASSAFAYNGKWYPRQGATAAGDWLKYAFASAKKICGLSFVPSYDTYSTSPNSIIWRVEGSTDGTTFDKILCDDIEMGRTLGFVPYVNITFEPQNLMAIRIYCKSAPSGASLFGIAQCRVYCEL